jgi:hypothetical protein
VLLVDGSESGAWLDRAPADIWISFAPCAARRGQERYLRVELLSSWRKSRTVPLKSSGASTLHT